MAAQQFNVIFAQNVSQDEFDRAKQELIDKGGEIKSDFSQGGILRGFSAVIPESYMSSLKSLQGGLIDTIEPDSVVSIQ
ncbi:serine proteinase inhibitor IA-1 [Hygrophoropsis aurantiaca]|uniref:Serine proteinase inhibitor IA-1 n=1 Tax=Hygrophoropsis aurantiaca TaxID=72124 RepID=A0ACB8ALH0_9AGAM|nr:serine proteinase inhibitor IA-1 [Hygrophoropsis aurantiaca]